MRRCLSGKKQAGQEQNPEEGDNSANAKLNPKYNTAIDA
jgi:hypothetical protein